MWGCGCVAVGYGGWWCVCFLKFGWPGPCLWFWATTSLMRWDGFIVCDCFGTGVGIMLLYYGVMGGIGCMVLVLFGVVIWMVGILVWFGSPYCGYWRVTYGIFFWLVWIIFLLFSFAGSASLLVVYIGS